MTPEEFETREQELQNRVTLQRRIQNAAYQKSEAMKANITQAEKYRSDLIAQQVMAKADADQKLQKAKDDQRAQSILAMDEYNRLQDAIRERDAFSASFVQVFGGHELV